MQAFYCLAQLCTNVHRKSSEHSKFSWDLLLAWRWLVRFTLTG